MSDLLSRRTSLSNSSERFTLGEMASGRAIIMASGRGPTGSGHIFIQQREAANQLHPDDMITFAANGEAEQVQ